MPWTKPDFVEISLAMEVTGYVNTDEQAAEEPVPNSEFHVPSSTLDACELGTLNLEL